MKLKNLLNIPRQINKPEFYFRPSQLVKRITYRNLGRRKVSVKIDRSQNPFFVNENEVIGSAILSQGVYDLVVGECVHRLLNPEDVFLDIGANIGYFSRRALQKGALTYSFEPHPNIFQRLEENLQHDPRSYRFQLALSNQEGEFDLFIPKTFATNEGIASLEPTAQADLVKVKTRTLDSFSFEKIRLIKIDVEGHEKSVLEGAQTLLQNKKVDYLVFEDFAGAKSPTIELLKQLDYKVHRLKKSLWGPRLTSVRKGLAIPNWEPPNYIACHNDQELVKLFSPLGWQILKSI